MLRDQTRIISRCVISCTGAFGSRVLLSGKRLLALPAASLAVVSPEPMDADTPWGLTCLCTLSITIDTV